MKCEIIRDLLPLYVDGVCCEETSAAVREHLETCSACRAMFENMRQAVPSPTVRGVPDEKAVYLRLRQNIGNFLLVCVFAVAFVGIAFGMLIEVGEHGFPQGVFAVSCVIPGAAFLLAVLNCFFYREYPSRRSFCVTSAAVSLAVCLIGDVLALFHYDFSVSFGGAVALCVLIGAVTAGAEYLLTFLYSRFCSR